MGAASLYKGVVTTHTYTFRWVILGRIWFFWGNLSFCSILSGEYLQFCLICIKYE